MAARVEFEQLRIGLVFHLAVASVELFCVEIVNNDHLAVGREMDVDLSRRRPFRPGQIDRGQGVFGRVVGSATMADNQAILRAVQRGWKDHGE